MPNEEDDNKSAIHKQIERNGTDGARARKVAARAEHRKVAHTVNVRPIMPACGNSPHGPAKRAELAAERAADQAAKAQASKPVKRTRAAAPKKES